MARSAVNDTMREMMAATARDFADRKGSLVSAGSSNAYTVTTNNNNAALADIGPLAFRAHIANTGAATLNVDGLGAKALRRPSGGVLTNGDLYVDRLVVVRYNAERDQFEVQNIGEFPPFTRMLFQQTFAPPGWTKDTTHNDKGIRITSGSVSSGGSRSFSTVFGITATDSTSITQAQMPIHLHGGDNLGGTANTVGSGHSHTVNDQYSTLSTVSSGTGATSVWRGIGGFGSTTNSGSHTHQLNVTGSTTSTGSSTGHTHGIDLRLQYVDFIIAVKD